MAPGEPQPQELRPESAARAALVGEREGLNRSQGEQALVAKAGLANTLLGAYVRQKAQTGGPA